MAAAVAAVGALALELFLRWFPQHLPAEARFRLEGEAVRAGGLRSRPHDYLGYLWPPHERDSIAGIELRFSYTTDQHGFRNATPWRERADVVVLGDSQAFGYGVEDHEAWVKLLDDALPASAVVNLGLIGAAPQQFLRIYEIYGVRLQPEVVVVALYPPNAFYAARLFDEWLADGKPDRFDARRSLPDRGGRDDLLSAIKDYARGSYLVRGLYYGVKELRSDPAPRAIEFDDGGRVQLIPGLFSDPEPAEFALVIDSLLRLRDIVERSGAELLVALFPTKEEAHLPLLGDASEAAWGPRVALFAAAFERLGIRYLDLTPILQERVARGDRLFLEIDVHPNPAGYRLIAEVVADHLAGLGASPGSSD